MKTKVLVLALVFGVPNLRLVSLLNALENCLLFGGCVFLHVFVGKGDG